MDSQYPTFSVFKVESGLQYGIYIEKEAMHGAPIQRAYFYPKPKDGGLLPTQEIIKACGDARFELDGAYSQYLILNELKAYAEAEHAEKPHNERRLVGKYDREKGYPGAAAHWFEHTDSALCEFVGGYNIFKTRILTTEHGRRNVKGMAKEFGVLSPQQVFPAEHFDYLQNLDGLLRAGRSKSAEWFRKSGPIAADFLHNKVWHPEERLEELRNLVMDHPVSLLEGVSASGKTVLVRTFAYDLYSHDCVRACHFNCEQPFDIPHLAREINSVRGIVILEDIHLNIQKVQLVLPRLKEHRLRHVLLTARPSFRETQHTRWEATLDSLPSLRLEPFDNVDRIIDCYASQQPHIDWSPHVRESIKEVAKDDFWLLAYALKGCLKDSGQGDPKNWVRDSVHQDLTSLENCDPPISAHFPEVLIALSPLYRDEIPTAERYLVDQLKIDKAILYALVARGEITRHTNNKGTLYGLPHSALAEAYWEHGQSYNRYIPSYEKLLREYILSRMPNALEVLARSRWPKLDKFLDKRVIQASVELIHGCNDIEQLAGCLWRVSQDDIEAARRIVKLLDIASLATSISLAHSGAAIGAVVSALRGINSDLARMLCALMDLEKLSRTLAASEEFSDVALCVSQVYHTNEQVGRRLWGLLDRGTLAEILLDSFDPLNTPACINQFRSKTALFWERIDAQHVAQVLQREKDLKDVLSCLHLLFHLVPTAAQKLWNHFDHRKIALKISGNPQIIREGALLISVLVDKEAQSAHDLVHFMDIRRVARTLSYTSRVHDALRFIKEVLQTDPATGDQLWRCINVQELATRINGEKRVKDYIFGMVVAICEVLGREAQVFCSLLDLRSLIADIGPEFFQERLHHSASVLKAVNPQTEKRFLDAAEGLGYAV